MADDSLQTILEAVKSAGEAKGNLGLGGIVSVVFNATEVAIVTLLFVYMILIMVPQEHERSALERQKDRDAHQIEVQKITDKHDDRLKNLWDEQVKMRESLVEISTILRKRESLKASEKAAPMK